MENQNKLNFKSRMLYLLCGVVVGAANGLFGGGGGMVAVPFMIYILKMPIKVSHATAIAIILPTSIISSLFYSNTSYSSLLYTAMTVIGVFVGGIIGAKMLKKLSNKVLIYLFSALMICFGIRLMF